MADDDDDGEAISESDCCNSGCDPCILDVRRSQKKNNSVEFSDGPTAIFPDRFSEFTVTEIEENGDHRLITFDASNKSENALISFKAGQYFILKAKTTDGVEISRPFTPLFFRYTFAESGKFESILRDGAKFQILVKIHASGAMSGGFLAALRAGDSALWRGPYGPHFEYAPNARPHALMLCQGSSASTMYATAASIVADERDETRLALACCCRSLERAFFRNELYALRSSWNFEYKLYVTTPPDPSTIKYEEPVKLGRLKREDIAEAVRGKETSVLVLIAGSDKFMEEKKAEVIACGVGEDNVKTFSCGD